MRRMGGSWIQRDNLRESWLVLVLGTESGTPSTPGTSSLYWEIGLGNSDTLADTRAQQIGYDGITSESELIDNLLTEMDQYRYDDTIIITPSESTLQLLRRRIIATNTQKESLRGFAHICIERQLSRYFGQSRTEQDLDHESIPAPRETSGGQNEIVSAGAVREIWESWQQLFRLLPAEQLTGQKL